MAKIVVKIHVLGSYSSRREMINQFRIWIESKESKKGTWKNVAGGHEISFNPVEPTQKTKDACEDCGFTACPAHQSTKKTHQLPHNCGKLWDKQICSCHKCENLEGKNQCPACWDAATQL